MDESTWDLDGITMDRPTCHCGKPARSKGIRAGKRVWGTDCGGCRDKRSRPAMNAKKKRQRKAKRLYIRGMKMRPCADCGVEYDWWKMQYDHVDPSTKLHNLSKAHSQSWATIHSEIAKCDVVCALCHADRTHKGKHFLNTRGEPAPLVVDPQCDMFTAEGIVR